MEGNVVEQGVGLYYQDTFWTDYPVGRAEVNRRATGDPDLNWSRHFQREVGGRVFERALILNCGNGWVERDLIDHGLVRSAVGVDSAQDLLDLAAQAAAAEGKDCSYHRMDTNTAQFPGGPFDLVVNHAAAHHVARLDRVFRACADLLPDDGYFVAYDYVGPDRNQYPWEVWEAAHALNDSLPEDLRQEMRYLNLREMMATDPTEALHPELMLEVLERHFHVRDLRRLGGAVAFPVLTHNPRLKAAEPAWRDQWMQHAFAVDADFLEAHPDSSFFVTWAAQPRRGADAPSDEQRLAWDREEDEREAAAVAAGGHYRPQSLLGRLEQERFDLTEARAHLYEHLHTAWAERDAAREELVATRAELDAARAEAAGARAELERVRALPTAPGWQRLREGPAGRVVRSSPPLRAAWARVRRRLDR